MTSLSLAALLACASPRPASAGGSSTAPGLALWTGSEPADRGLAFDFAGVEPFDRAVMSWNADGPATFALEVAGKQYVMGRWGDQPRSETTASVDEDTLKLLTPATAFRMRVLPSTGTTVTRLAVTFWRNGAIDPLGPVSTEARGRVLKDVPHFVQKDNKTCSPTSVAMVLKYYGVAATPESATEGVKDHAPDASEVYGNWPFNTAYAYKAAGGRLAAHVRRMSGLAQLESELAAGRPTIVSIKPNGRKGQGHLVVVIGFDKKGDVVLNDPGRRAGAGRVVSRAHFYQTWLEDAQGVAYVIAPK